MGEHLSNEAPGAAPPMEPLGVRLVGTGFGRQAIALPTLRKSECEGNAQTRPDGRFTAALVPIAAELGVGAGAKVVARKRLRHATNEKPRPWRPGL
jgi:hypothetical protein